MRIKHLNMINMNMNMINMNMNMNVNMNMMKEAIDVLINSEKHILIIGETGTGKSTLLTELLINDTDVKHLKQHYLCDENFDDFDFLSAPEKTLVLDSVAIGNNLQESKVVQFIVRFIKTARKRGKRLIVVTTPSDGGVQIQNLFDTVISLTRSHD
ncbi:TPA: ATP-binding protein, partial [Escherichia coli]